MFAFLPLQLSEYLRWIPPILGIPQAFIAGRMVSFSYKRTIALTIANLAVDLIHYKVSERVIETNIDHLSDSFTVSAILTAEAMEKYCLFALFNHPYPALPFGISSDAGRVIRLVLALHGMDSVFDRRWGLGLTEIPPIPQPGWAGIRGETNVQIARRRGELPLHPFRNNWWVRTLISGIFCCIIGRALGVKSQHSIALWAVAKVLEQVSLRFPQILNNRVLLRGVMGVFRRIAWSYAALRFGATDRLVAGMNLSHQWGTLNSCAQMIGRIALASAGYDKYFSPAWQVFRDTEY